MSEKVVVEVTVRMECWGLPGGDSESFAMECVESALQGSDEIQRCFSGVSVVSSCTLTGRVMSDPDGD